MSLADQKAAAQARLAAAQAALSDDEKGELATREEIASIEAEAKATEDAKKELDIERRLERARVELGPDSPVVAVSWEHFPDTFVVMRNGAAHARWLAATKSRASGAKTDQIATDRQFAISCAYDWNGTVLGDPNLTTKLNKFLTDNPGLVIPLTDAAAKLVGVFAEARKS